ncbi:hypothetical protein GCM10027160_22900 [Streptomyces calidiresistens]|uniref:Antitoxin n=1 Tax=Streptomyces calidiresistens TaxID=1485586 RepID=A0A7W3T5C1_9ACTN|nr:hypothetical protein [Streptomyces calidiresistens]MBB0231240.1 hypothetical protein [Streptomyces calidiresistens]
MAGFLDRAKEQAQKGYRSGREKLEQGIEQGRDKLSDVQAQRAGNELLRSLGAAYYRKEHGTGSEQEVGTILKALEDHITEHGDAFLR